MELEEPRFEFKPSTDERPRMSEPIPVELEAVDDLQAPIPKCDRKRLDQLYCEILQFAPVPDAPQLTYQANNFALRFELAIPERQDYRPIRVIVRSLTATEAKLVAAEIEYSRQKGIMPGQEILVLQDADGNWVEIREHREVG